MTFALDVLAISAKVNFPNLDKHHVEFLLLLRRMDTEKFPSGVKVEVMWYSFPIPLVEGGLSFPEDELILFTVPWTDPNLHVFQLFPRAKTRKLQG